MFKLKLNHASILRPDDVGKLTLNGNFLSVYTETQSCLDPRTRWCGKLTFYDIYLFLTKCQDRPKIITTQIGSFEGSNLQYKYGAHKAALPHV